MANVVDAMVEHLFHQVEKQMQPKRERAGTKSEQQRKKAKKSANADRDGGRAQVSGERATGGEMDSEGTATL